MNKRQRKKNEKNYINKCLLPKDGNIDFNGYVVYETESDKHTITICDPLNTEHRFNMSSLLEVAKNLRSGERDKIIKQEVINSKIKINNYAIRVLKRKLLRVKYENKITKS